MASCTTDNCPSDYIAHLDGESSIAGGWLNHNWKQLYIQLADSASGAAYSFVGTLAILYVLHFASKVVPALTLRATTEEEDMGMDDVEIGEFAVSVYCSLSTCRVVILTEHHSTIMSSLHAI